MIFSTEFKIERTTMDDWFDPILLTDTNLLIAPFLVFDTDPPFFNNSHQTTIDYITFVDHLLDTISVTLAKKRQPKN